MTGDGGFSVRGTARRGSAGRPWTKEQASTGRENEQELLSRRLVLCQFLVAFATLRAGGTFVCKLFDTFLPLTVPQAARALRAAGALTREPRRAGRKGPHDLLLLPAV